MSEKAFNVLIVDDVASMREVIMYSLEDLHCQMFQATEGAAGLEIMRKNNIDLVISDLNMPGMNGMELLRKIRQMNIDSPPVFILSAYCDVSIEDIYDKGAERIISKPFSPVQLLEDTKTVLEKKQIGFEVSKDRLEQFAANYQNLTISDSNIHHKHVVFGRRGAFIPIDTKVNFKRGSILEFDLSFSEGEKRNLKFVGFVEWVRKQAKQDLQTGMGVRFVEMNPTDLEYIKSRTHEAKIIASIPMGKTHSKAKIPA